MLLWTLAVRLMAGQLAQTNTGELHVIVTDTAGLPLAGAVDITSESNQIHMRLDTDAQGLLVAKRLSSPDRRGVKCGCRPMRETSRTARTWSISRGCSRERRSRLRGPFLSDIACNFNDLRQMMRYTRAVEGPTPQPSSCIYALQTQLQRKDGHGRRARRHAAALGLARQPEPPRHEVWKSTCHSAATARADRL